ncbi:hypothetical protein PV328_005725 [Microctonus aethiopoides]|uniref:Uncharacterized protein n=1 Tax=Microctonus aethiopoides TaxID=144406 RepID=A0AA39KSW7_9HYME|nr:hypothetical protein PV328_005725 [Microctonus aethiopoides]
MVKVLCTIWALMLNAAKIYVFQTCCENPFEDDEDTMIIGPPLPAFFFATGVYVILAQISLLPQSFQKPIGVILCVYEFLSTLFIIEFCVTCIWVPVNVLILSTIPNTISHVLIDLNDYAAAEWFEKSQHVLMTMILFIVSIGFLLISLHVAKALDFSILTDYGVMAFLECAVQQLWRRLVNEFRRSHGCILDCSTLNDRNRRPKKPRKRRRPFRECNCSTDS